VQLANSGWRIGWHRPWGGDENWAWDSQTMVLSIPLAAPAIAVF
jgi:hypothetical protein